MTESTDPAVLRPSELALAPAPEKDPRLEPLQRELAEAQARLKRVREYRFVLYGEIRRCLAVLGDLAAELVGEDRFEELKREAELLSPEPLLTEGGEGEETLTDPALAWMEPEQPAVDSLEVSGSPAVPPSSEETSRAARTLRECLEYLEAADRSTPDFHLAILQAEDRLRALEEALRPPSPPPVASDAAASGSSGAPGTAAPSPSPSAARATGS